MMSFNYLIVAGALSLIASVAHIFIIVGGPKWYRFFGAGEQMVLMAEARSIRPALITGMIAFVLGVWTIYAWSGAGILPKMPLLKLGLVLITGIYLVRGVMGFLAPYISNHSAVKANSKSFWFWSSLICSIYGVIHLAGLIHVWSHI